MGRALSIIDRSSIYPVLLTVMLIEAPSLLLTAQIVSHSFHPGLIVSLLALLQVAALGTLILCVYTDPGILPQIVDKYSWDQQQAGIPSVNHLNISEHKYLMVTGQLITHQKYCVECYIYRPLRTIHCQACNHCVERYDHHCPWLGVCIGKYNYRYFFAFITVLSCLSASIAVISLAMIFQLLHDYPVHQYLIEILLAAAASFLFFPVFKLFTYHLQLFHNRQTTNEDLKGLYHILKGPAPFQRCELNPRPSLVPLKGKMILNVQKEEYRVSISSDRGVEKGKRYSTLVSDRQSVLNYLVETQL